MREIKFRAWDKNDQMMYEVSEMVYSQMGIDWKAKGDHALESWRGDADFMQYTGLKDKNGKEIYEGDLLAWENDGERDLYKVIYEAPSFKYTHLKNPEFIGATKAFDELESLDFEVIGNIYENCTVCLAIC